MGISAGIIWNKGLEFATTKKALYVFWDSLGEFFMVVDIFWFETTILGIY